MPVGSDPKTIFQGQDFNWLFTMDDVRIANITGQVIAFSIKQAASEPDPALISGTCTIVGTQQFRMQGYADLVPGVYTVGARRSDASHRTQYAQFQLTVKDSVNVDNPS